MEKKEKKLSDKILLIVIGVLIIAIGTLGFFILRDDEGSNNDEVHINTSEIESTTEASSENSTEASKEETTEKASEELAKDQSQYVELKSANNWDNNGKFNAQIDATIFNKSSADIKNWEIRIKVPDNTVLDSSWNGNFVLENNEIRVTAVDYNQTIAAGGSAFDIGFIVGIDKESDLASILQAATLYVDGKAVSNIKAPSDKEDKTEEENKKEEKEEANVKPESGTPFDNHGKLSVKGVDIVDKNGKKYQLKGVSTHGIAWFPQYVSEETFKSFRDDFGANLIRIAMYTDENGGYCSGGDKDNLKKLVDDGVNAATKLGMYVIVDWHILHDLNPQVNKADAKAFFEEVSKKYSKNDNVIYEICNEPNGGTSWEDVKAYAEEIIPIIRKNSKNAIIIVGTPNWSQDVDVAAANPVTGYDNIMYAVHFYAATHTDNIRSKVTTALSKGLPIFVSEFSICDASGNGAIDYTQAEKWFELIKENNLSYAAWNISNKAETSSLIKASCDKISGWTDDELSETGLWLKKTISGK